MRYLLILLVILSMEISPCSILAEELFLVKIEAVDKEAGKLWITILQDSGSINIIKKDQKKETVTPLLLENKAMAMKFLAGDVTRVWADTGGPAGELTINRVLSANPSGLNKDPSGVRRRLRRHMRRPRNPGRQSSRGRR